MKRIKRGKHSSRTFSRPSQSTRIHDLKRHTHERVILLLFLVFVCFSLIILFKAPIQEILIGKATSGLQLEKTSFNASETIKGTLNLALDPADVLPNASTMNFLILTNATKLSKQYICPNGALINWNNETALLTPDPEGDCCVVSGLSCTQIVLNSKFDAELRTTKGRWVPAGKNIDVLSQILTNSEIVGLDDEENQISSLVLVLNSYPLTLNLSYAKVTQQFSGSRQIKFSDLLPVCYDSDGGDFPKIPGNTIINGTDHKDFCTGGNLTEYYCNNSVLSSKTHNCGTFGMFCSISNGMGSCSPPSAITSVPTGSGSVTNISKLEYDIAASTSSSEVGPCAFEVKITSTNNNALHYFYLPDMSGCTEIPHTTNSSDLYKVRTGAQVPTITDSISETSWKKESIDIYNDWKSAFNHNETLSNIQLISYGKQVGDSVYSQSVYFDNVKLRKAGDFSPTFCNETSKGKCCVSGTGYGSYYGEQLTCDSDYECWSECTENKKWTLKTFVQQSTTPSKNNFTEDYCIAITEEGRIELFDYCGLGGVGKGYTACLNTSSTRYPNCLNWTNAYTLNMSKLAIKTPSENGTYTFVWEYSYYPTEGGCGLDNNESCPIFTKTFSFGVGTIPVPPEANWTCNTWNSCSGGLQFTNCTDSNSGITELRNRTCCWSCSEWEPTTCPENLMQTRNCSEFYESTSICPIVSATIPSTSQNCSVGLPGCTTSDWNCDEWSKCENGWQSRACTKLTSCDETVYSPAQEQECTKNKSLFSGMFLWIIIIVVVIVVIIFVLKPFKQHTSSLKTSGTTFGPSTRAVTTGSKARYPEVVSYIKDASASGASRKDIEQKLSEAGWPRDIIEDSFKEAGI